MHIPENYLSPSTCAVLGAAMLPVWGTALARGRREPREKLSLLGTGAAFSFLVMMLNLPLPGGTTGHAVGAVLLAILLGPWNACLSVSVALLVQALFFGDGGILSLGANCLNMAFIMPFAGYGVWRLLAPRLGSRLAAALGAYVGLNLAALAAAVEFGVQPLWFTDAAGQALYCPYPLGISIPAMMLGHLTVAGLAEALVTAAVLAYLEKAAPALLAASPAPASVSSGRRAFYGFLVALLLVTPLGLLAEGTAWGEWSPEELPPVEGAALGYTPAGMEKGFSFPALFPDYVIEGTPDIVSCLLSAIIGTALLVIFFKLLAPVLRREV